MPCHLSYLDGEVVCTDFCRISVSFSIGCFLEMSSPSCVITHWSRSQIAAFLPNFLLCSGNVRFLVAVAMESIFIPSILEAMIAFTFWAGEVLSVLDNSCNCLATSRRLTSCFIEDGCCFLEVKSLHNFLYFLFDQSSSFT